MLFAQLKRLLSRRFNIHLLHTLHGTSFLSVNLAEIRILTDVFDLRVKKSVT